MVGVRRASVVSGVAGVLAFGMGTAGGRRVWAPVEWMGEHTGGMSPTHSTLGCSEWYGGRGGAGRSRMSLALKKNLRLMGLESSEQLGLMLSTHIVMLQPACDSSFGALMPSLAFAGTAHKMCRQNTPTPKSKPVLGRVSQTLWESVFTVWNLGMEPGWSGLSGSSFIYTWRRPTNN